MYSDRHPSTILLSLSLSRSLALAFSSFSCKTARCFECIMLANLCHAAAGHAYFPAVLESMPLSSINSALTHKAWYEDADQQTQIRVLLHKSSKLEDESELAEHNLVDLQLQKDCPEAHKQLSALLDSDHLDDTAYALLNLLCRGDLPEFSEKDNDPFLTFVNEEYYLAQSEL